MRGHLFLGGDPAADGLERGQRPLLGRAERDVVVDCGCPRRLARCFLPTTLSRWIVRIARDRGYPEQVVPAIAPSPRRGIAKIPENEPATTLPGVCVFLHCHE